MKRQTLNQIATAFKNRLNLSFSTTNVYAASTPGAKQVLQLIYDTCEELRQAACWQHQLKTYTITTASGQSKYPLPKDFYALVPASQWHSDNNQRLSGPIMNHEFSGFLYGVDASTYSYAFRIAGVDFNQTSGGGQIELNPTPTATETLKLEYLTANLFMPPYWTEGESIGSSGIYRNSNGYNYVSTGSGTAGSDAPDHTSGSVSDGGVTWTYYDTAYEAALTDSDLCIFDPDLVKLGLRAKWIDEKGEVSESAEAEFRSKIEAAKARWLGPVIGSFSRRGNAYRRYQFPSGGWSL